MWIPIIVVAALIMILLLVQYNGLVSMRQLTSNAWADVDVYLKRRAELIPNLVTTVKAYATHEQTVFTAVTEARSRAAALQGASSAKAQAETDVAQSLVNVVAVAEAYPELRSSENYLRLQNDLSETERLIANARQYYNACVRDYNTKIEAFPSNVVSTTFGFKPMDFFELESATERLAPKVS